MQLKIILKGYLMNVSLDGEGGCSFGHRMSLCLLQVSSAHHYIGAN